MRQTWKWNDSSLGTSCPNSVGQALGGVRRYTAFSEEDAEIAMVVPTRSVLGYTEDGERCRCTKASIDAVMDNDHMQSSKDFQKRIKDAKVANADRKMDEVIGIYEKRKGRYEGLLGGLENAFASYEHVKYAADEAYGAARTLYKRTCRKVADRYDVYPDCKTLNYKMIDEYMSRGITPNCAIGAKGVLKPFRADVQAEKGSWF